MLLPLCWFLVCAANQMLDAGYWIRIQAENIQHQVSSIQNQFGENDPADGRTMTLQELET
jgi:hypothetical protein